MAQLKVKQTKSGIGSNPKQRKTLKALGLDKVGKEITHKDCPEIKGMLNIVNHLVTVEKV